MNRYSSPLRYPGGKTRIAGFLEDMIVLNDLEGCTFYELYAGGAGAALSLLLSGHCAKIVLNDLDTHIFNFWKALLDESEEFIRLIETAPITIDEWKKHQEVYVNHREYSSLEIGFSTFFLNRCNRSGILYKAGPIGGMNQNGNYKIDCRFNKQDLISRIELIANNRDNIQLLSEETISAVGKLARKEKGRCLFFLDPPYFAQGENLYLNHYHHKDHAKLAGVLSKMSNHHWFLTYDNCSEINSLYQKLRRAELPMSYTLQSKVKAKEVMVFSPNLVIPKSLRQGNMKSNMKFLSDGVDAA